MGKIFVIGLSVALIGYITWALYHADDETTDSKGSKKIQQTKEENLAMKIKQRASRSGTGSVAQANEGRGFYGGGTTLIPIFG